MSKSNKNIAICVGTTKAGTSWLYKCLEEHRDVNPAIGKETNFFAQDNVDCEGFFDYFTEKVSTKIFFESSPKYFSNLEAIQSIRECFPEAKIIIMLRDPVERAVSHIRHMISVGRYPDNTDLQTVIEKTPTVLQHSQYSIYLPKILNEFDSSRCLVINFSSISDEPQMVVDNVCDFLNIERFTPKFLNTKYNVGTARNHPWFWKITKLYVKARRFAAVRSAMKISKMIGFDSTKLESFLALTSRQKSILTKQEREDLKDILSDEQKFYTEYFAQKIQ